MGDNIEQGLLDNYTDPAEVICNGARVNNMVLRGGKVPSVELDGKYDSQKLYSEGENIASNYLLYKTHSAIGNIDETDIEELPNTFNTMLGLKKHTQGNNAAAGYPELTKQDIDIIKRIDQEIVETDYTNDPFYYIAF